MTDQQGDSAGLGSATVPQRRDALRPGALRYDARGLIPAIVQEHATGEVLMMAWMSEATLTETLETGQTVFYSRSRGERWHKGETSGNTQRVVEVVADCDADVLLVRVKQQGAGACHTGAWSCFARAVAVRP